MMHEDESFDQLVREKLNSREFRPSAERRAKARLAIEAHNAKKSSRFRFTIIFAIVMLASAILAGNYFIGGKNRTQNTVAENKNNSSGILPNQGIPNESATSASSDFASGEKDSEKNTVAKISGKNETADNSIAEQNSPGNTVAQKGQVTDKNSDRNLNRKETDSGTNSSAYYSSPNNNGAGESNSASNPKAKNDFSGSAKNGNDFKTVNHTSSAGGNTIDKSDHQKANSAVSDPVKNQNEKTGMNSSSDHSIAENNRDPFLYSGKEYTDSVKMKSYHTQYAADSVKMKSFHTEYANDSVRMKTYHTEYADDSVRMKTYHTEYAMDSSGNKTVADNSTLNNHPGNVNYFFIEAGITFIPGFSARFQSGRSVNPVIGAGFCFRTGMKTGIQLGLHYTFIGNASDSNLVFTNTSFGFGAQVEYTEVKLKRLHYASLPVRFLYHLNSKNAFDAGVNLNYLFATEMSMHTYSAANPDINSTSKFGYLQGINRFDVQVSAGYTRTFGSQWSAGISLYSGLMDIKKNSFFGVNKFERNKGLQLTIQYAF